MMWLMVLVAGAAYALGGVWTARALVLRWRRAHPSILGEPDGVEWGMWLLVASLLAAVWPVTAAWLMLIEHTRRWAESEGVEPSRSRERTRP